MQSIRVMLTRYLHIRVIAALVCVCVFLHCFIFREHGNGEWGTLLLAEIYVLKCMPLIQSLWSTRNKETGAMCLCMFFFKTRMSAIERKIRFNHL